MMIILSTLIVIIMVDDYDIGNRIVYTFGKKLQGEDSCLVIIGSIYEDIRRLNSYSVNDEIELYSY